MPVETVAVVIGLLAGAVVLAGLWVLAARKAARAGERTLVVYVRCLAFLALLHGLGLVLVTGAVALAVPVPEAERAWMAYFSSAGMAFLVVGGAALRWTDLSRPAPGAAAGPARPA